MFFYFSFFCLKQLPPPKSTLTDTLLPYTPLFRSQACVRKAGDAMQQAVRYAANTLENHWMPFTSNRDFKQDPRLLVKSEGLYYWNHHGDKLIDGSSEIGRAHV